MLVGVPYLESDRCSCGFTLENSAEKLHFVSFVSGSCNMTLSWSATIQFTLNEIHINFDASREAVNYTAYSYTMAFAKSGKREEIAKSISHKIMGLLS